MIVYRISDDRIQNLHNLLLSYTVRIKVYSYYSWSCSNYTFSYNKTQFYKNKLAGVIKAKEEFMESTGSRRNDAIAERRRKQTEAENEKKAKERQKMREKRIQKKRGTR